MFKDADFLAGQFERGDLVRVSGRVERFRDELTIDVGRSAAESGAADPADFLPVAYRDLDELTASSSTWRARCTTRTTRAARRSSRDDAFRAQFRRAPCTRAGHHAYLGGLLEHTVAVARSPTSLHRRIRASTPTSCSTAALLHDIGKIAEFDLRRRHRAERAGRLLGHLALGDRMVAERAGGMPEAKLLALLHCILGHHGARVLPGRRFGSVEALALYRVNALDAAVKGALEHGLGQGAPGQSPQ